MLIRDFIDPFRGKSGVFHFSMPHLDNTSLFASDADFKAGVNYLAITSASCVAVLLCYCLMDNHFHLLLAGRLEDCIRFYDSYITRLSRYIARSRNRIGLLHKNTVDIQAVTTDKQFRNEVLYILRNPYKARICSPYTYRWSSVDAYFCQNDKEYKDGISDEMTLREFRELFKTRVKHDNMAFLEGKISNRCFVDYQYVENRIGDSLTFFDTMRLYDLESVVETSHGIEETVVFSDAELKERISTVCRNEFYADSVLQLSRKDLLSLARILAKRYGAKKKQIARLTGLPPETLDSLL